MTKAEATKRIKAIKPRWKTTFIHVIKVFVYRGRLYTIVDFTYKGTAYEYRKNIDDEFIVKC